MRHLLLSYGLLLCVAVSTHAAPNADPFPTPPDKKGLQVQMVDDALALGIHHAAININLSALLDAGNKPANPHRSVEGETFSFNAGYLNALDRQIKPLADAGVVVYAILLIYPTKDPKRDAILVHPQARKDHRYNVAAFNTGTDRGRHFLTAVVEQLAERWSGDHPEHGRMWGWIAGNEANSHWLWYNLGRAGLEQVASEYEKAVRLIHSAVRRHSTNARVYLSFDHHWKASMPGISAEEAVPGREFLDTFARLSRERGDFDWHVAYHPYPDDLGNPRTWLDKAALPSDDSPHVTFKNLEVLTRHLTRPNLLYQNQPRRVILSEQGFHCPQSPDGETLQAAAFAYAWEKVQRLPLIDAFIWHRHVDHKLEGGLRLGLWERKPDSIVEPLRQRQIYNLFKKAGTPEWTEASAFALPVCGLHDWSPLNQRETPPAAD